MSKKIMKRSLALGALMAFVITGSAWASIDLDGVTIGSTNTSYSVNSSDSTLTINGEIFQNITSPGNQFITITKGTANITDTDFLNIGVNGKSSKAVIISQSGGEVNLTNVVIQPNYKASNGLNVNTGSTGNIYGKENTFKGYQGRGVYNYGTLTFKKDSVTTFDAPSKGSFDISNRGGKVVVEEGAVVYLNGKGIDIDTGSGTVDIHGTVIGNISGNNTVNFKGGELYGKMSEGFNNSRVSTGFCTVNFNDGTWNLTGDSVVTGIVSDCDVTINGVDGNSLTVNNTITEKGKYAITHNSGTLTIKNLTIEDVIKEYNKQPANDNGIVRASVLYSNNSGKIVIEDSIIQDNSNTGDCKNYAVIDVTTNMDVKNTEFKNNQSSYMGGALYLHDKEFNIKNSEFVSNAASQGAAIQSNSATINFFGNTFENNIATKADDGDCGGAICAQGAGVITFKGVNTFEGNKATGANGCGGAIAQYYKGSKIVFEKDSYTEFINNTANGNGGAIWNGDDTANGIDSVIEVNGDLVFEGNTAGKEGNDIYNKSALKFLGGNTKVSGGIVSEGANAYVEISNDAVVELNGGTTSLNKLQGNGGVIHFTNADAGLAVEANTNKTLKFTATSAVNEAVAGDANALVSEVDWAADTTMVMEAGDVVGEVTAELGENEKTGCLMVKSFKEAINPANEAISDTGISMKLHWRAHVNDMNKRMGELRDANGEHGVWTRMVRGESEYKNTKAQYNQYQLGYDEKLSVDKRWTVGAAVTFSEGDASYGYGSTEDKSTAFAIYGSKLNNDGTFVDLIARYAHLESDVDDQAGKGSYSANGMSVSAEFGKRIQQGNGLWIEPQAELTYGTIDSAEYKLGTKTVEVGDMDSLIGRIGFRIGKDIEKGNVYARASYLYDFEGEIENAFRNDTARRSFNEDLGGSWWEVGVGANINLSKATYVYADVEKTFGGEVDTNWQWNLGVRYSF